MFQIIFSKIYYLLKVVLIEIVFYTLNFRTTVTFNYLYKFKKIMTSNQSSDIPIKYLLQH